MCWIIYYKQLHNISSLPNKFTILLIQSVRIECNICSLHPCTVGVVSIKWRGSRGHDRMVVGFTTTYAIGANHH